MNTSACYSVLTAPRGVLSMRYLDVEELLGAAFRPNLTPKELADLLRGLEFT